MADGLRGSQPPRPAIVVLAAGAPAVVREVAAGIEEEGVPFQTGPLSDRSAAADLAMRAAARSGLQVGVGVGAAGDVSVCHVRLEQPVFDLAAGTARPLVRLVGHNAARMVVGLPLKTMPDGEFAEFCGHVGLDTRA